MRRFSIIFALPLLIHPAAATDGAGLDREAAISYLREADALCRADGGRVWGRTLCGPLLIVDPGTRQAVSNTADPGASLSGGNGIFVGRLPDELPLANTAVRWQGQTWAMILWPLPVDRDARAILMIHESWHRIQGSLGLSASERQQDHLVTAEGRTALRLELRALARALVLRGAASSAALADALLFRAWRYTLFPAAEANERSLERNEGLAEYSGWRIAAPGQMDARLSRRLAQADSAPSFARNFAYQTGPAYGLLLDRNAPGWRRRLGPATGFADLFPTRFRPAGRLSRATIERAGASYGYRAVHEGELRLAETTARAQASWRALLVDGPRVRIPMLGANIVFNPNDVQPLGPAGNVYPHLSAVGIWGRLDVTGGGLLASDWSALVLPDLDLRVAGTTITARGWRLDLADGWSFARDAAGQGRIQPGQNREQITPPGHHRR